MVFSGGLFFLATGFGYPYVKYPTVAPSLGVSVVTLVEAQRVRTGVMTSLLLRWVRASAPTGCSPRGLRGVFDSFEVFSALCQGALLRLSPRGVLGPLSFEVSFLRSSPKPRTREVDQDLVRLHGMTLTHLLEKEEGWGSPYYPRWVSSNDLR
jgi:hypothetical protein